MTAPPGLDALTSRSLYLLLFATEKANVYHWVLYFHDYPGFGGYKFHIQKPSVDGRWRPDRGTIYGAVGPFVLALRLSAQDLSLTIDDTLREDDDRLNDFPGMTSRVWALRALTRVGDRCFIMFDPDIQAFEREVMAFAAAAIKSGGHQHPRRIDYSRVCGMKHA